MSTKSELIAKDVAGEFVEGFVHCDSMWSASVILECDGEFVFGYWQYMDEPKEYFLRKLEPCRHQFYPDDYDYKFRTIRGTYRLSNFMRQPI